jgi:branched-chain amino acid aminotransferase
MSEALLDSFIYNGEILNISKFENLYVEKKPSIYEVIRIMHGVPLFLEEHYERLIKSADVIGQKLDIPFEEVKDNIYKMIKSNNVTDYNIKIVINNLDNSKTNKYYFFISSKYPSHELYQTGVRTFLYKAERKDPHAKIINTNLRDEINLLLKQKDCYESLLVNDKNEITEGSRSNVFFIKQEKLFTSPAKDVLLGITRQRIISLCKRNNIEVVETPISVEDLNSFDSAFICGTSPKVLPIYLIDNINLATTDNLLKMIVQIYNDEITNYINEHK